MPYNPIYLFILLFVYFIFLDSVFYDLIQLYYKKWNFTNAGNQTYV